MPMQSTLKPKQPDDPHDVLEVAPGVVLVAPADPAEEELSNLLRAAARQHSDPQRGTGAEFAAGPSVPPVDTTFRPAAVGNIKPPGNRPAMGGRVLRGFTGFLLAICIGVGAAAWQAYGDTAQRMFARWAPQFLSWSSQASQAGVPVSAANTASPQPAAPAQAAAEGVAPPAAPSSDEMQSLQSMARDLAAAGQEIEQLKASIAQLKASQDQMSRDVARVSEGKAAETKVPELRGSEPNLRSRISAPPPRSAAPARRPIATYRPSQAAVAPMMPPPAPAPYVSRQPDPLPPPAAQVPLDPELSSVPRPPMPVR